MGTELVEQPEISLHEETLTIGSNEEDDYLVMRVLQNTVDSSRRGVLLIVDPNRSGSKLLFFFDKRAFGSHRYENFGQFKICEGGDYWTKTTLVIDGDECILLCPGKNSVGQEIVHGKIDEYLDRIWRLYQSEYANPTEEPKFANRVFQLMETLSKSLPHDGAWNIVTYKRDQQGFLIRSDSNPDISHFIQRAMNPGPTSWGPAKRWNEIKYKGDVTLIYEVEKIKDRYLVVAIEGISPILLADFKSRLISSLSELQTVLPFDSSQMEIVAMASVTTGSRENSELLRVDSPPEAIRHELTHDLFKQFLGGYVRSNYLSEGLAMFYGNEVGEVKFPSFIGRISKIARFICDDTHEYYGGQILVGYILTKYGIQTLLALCKLLTAREIPLTERTGDSELEQIRSAVESLNLDWNDFFIDFNSCLEKRSFEFLESRQTGKVSRSKIIMSSIQAKFTI